MIFGPWIPVTTMAGRLAVIGFGVAVLIGCLLVSHRVFSRSFFHGFMVSTGIFLSFDIVVFHWVFQLHRMTSGVEANVVEPVLVLVGIVFVGYGFARERNGRRTAAKRAPTAAGHGRVTLE